MHSTTSVVNRQPSAQPKTTANEIWVAQLYAKTDADYKKFSSVRRKLGPLPESVSGYERDAYSQVFTIPKGRHFPTTGYLSDGVGIRVYKTFASPRMAELPESYLKWVADCQQLKRVDCDPGGGTEAQQLNRLYPHLKMLELVPNEKAPIRNRGVYAATNEPSQIKKFRHNLGIRTGKASGVFVVDFDSDDSAAIDRFEAEFGKLPHTVSSKTPRGRHFYFRLPAGVTIKSRVGFRAKVDICSENKYVVAPPSTVSEIDYEWINSPFDCGFAEAPAGLVDALAGKKESKPQAKTAKQEPSQTYDEDKPKYVPRCSSDQELKARLIELRTTKVGQRYARLPEVVRTIVNAKGKISESELEPWFDLWFDGCVHRDTRKRTWQQALHLWKTVREPKNGSSEDDQKLWDECKEDLLPSWVFSDFPIVRTLHHSKVKRNKGMHHLIRFLRRKQAQSDGSFHLGCRALGELMSVGHKAAARALKELTRLGFLTKEMEFMFDSDNPDSRLAREYSVVRETNIQIKQNPESSSVSKSRLYKPKTCVTYETNFSINGCSLVLPVDSTNQKPPDRPPDSLLSDSPTDSASKTATFNETGTLFDREEFLSVEERSRIIEGPYFFD